MTPERQADVSRDGDLQLLVGVFAMLTLTIVMWGWATFVDPNDVEGMTNAGVFSALFVVVVSAWLTRRRPT
jgi:hypothetical protein